MKGYSSESGAAVVETVISIFAFLALILLTIDTARIGFQTATSQWIVDRAIRDVVLGVKIGNDVTAPTVPQVEALVKNYAKQVHVDLTADQILVCTDNPIVVTAALNAGNTCAGGAPESVGAGRDLVSIEIKYDVRFFFWLWSQTISARAMGKLEPF